MDTEKTVTSHRQATINGLAVVGFIALVIAGIWLAVYSTRFVPAVVNRIGTAAVYLGSIFTPSGGPTLSVVPTASTTISFGTAATTSTGTTFNNTKPVATNVGEKTSGTYQIGDTETNALYGLPDLAVNSIATGYLALASTDSFVASSAVPYGSRAAVTFTIKNIGTNWSGTWRFSASIPTQTAYTYNSQPQQSLAPGDSIDYTLGFDRAKTGYDQSISITANFDNTASESNINNNSVTAKITILGP